MEKFMILIPLLAFATLAFSQDNVQTNSTMNMLYLESVSDVDALNFMEECVFMDTDEQLCYVDFQKVRVNLKEVHIIDENGNIVYSKNVSDLPVDTILEIDYRGFKKGKYIIELRSYTNSLHKRITIT